jgi:hypothetical protein
MEMVELRLELKNQKPAGTGWIRRVFGPRKVEYVIYVNDNISILYHYNMSLYYIFIKIL